MASKIPQFVSRLSKSNAAKVLLRQNNERSMSTLQPKVKAKMELYGIEDGTPVFKKSGTTDSLMFQFTMGACVASLGLIAMNMAKMAFKK